MTSPLWTIFGYGVASLLFIVLPLALARWVVGTRSFARRRRIRWAGERRVWWRDQMEELGPLGADPDVRSRKTRD